MKYLLILVLGLVLGAGAAIFFLGIPRTKSAPGVKVQGPSQTGEQKSTIVVTVSNTFFEQFLGTLFRDLNPPALRLGSAERQTEMATLQNIAFQQGCANTITLAQEGSSVKTQVRFVNNNISVPLAFNGNYNLLGNCMQFKGWAQTSIQLRFDQSNQTIYGTVNVDAVNLEGVNPIANNFVTVFVRDAIDQKVNPLELIRAPQLQLAIPVKASNGEIKANVTDVRSEVLDGSLKLHITYEFSGQRSG
jgi:hypothetical protein